jgi:hypothetical protein
MQLTGQALKSLRRPHLSLEEVFLCSALILPYVRLENVTKIERMPPFRVFQKTVQIDTYIVVQPIGVASGLVAMFIRRDERRSDVTDFATRKGG